MSDSQQSGNEQRPFITVTSQYIADLSFESPNAPHIFGKMLTNKPKISVNVSVDVKRYGEELFEVSLNISVDARIENPEATEDPANNEVVFISELKYCGTFEIRNMQPDDLDKTLLIYCPSLLFPYARKVIADATSDGGFPPLMMDPIDFAALYIRQQMNAQNAN